MRSSRQNTSISLTLLRKVIFYTVIFFVLSVAQISFFSQLSFLRAVPNIALCGVAAVALLDDRNSAIICAIATGFLVDALGGAGLSLSPLTFMLAALLFAQISKKMLAHFLSWLILLVVASAVACVITALNIFIGFGASVIPDILLSLLLPELITTYVVSVPIFFVMRLGVRFTETKTTFKI